MTRNEIWGVVRERSPPSHRFHGDPPVVARDRAVATPQRSNAEHPLHHARVQLTIDDTLRNLDAARELNRVSLQLGTAKRVIRRLADLCRVHAPAGLAAMDGEIRQVLAESDDGADRAPRLVMHAGVIHGPETADAQGPRPLLVEVGADTTLTPTVLDTSDSEDNTMILPENVVAGGA